MRFIVYIPLLLLSSITTALQGALVNPAPSPVSLPPILHSPIPDKSVLDDNGHISEAGAAHLLLAAAKKLSIPVSEDSTLTVTRMAKEHQKAPWKTTQLFSASLPNGTSFVIKGMKDGNQEIDDLERARKLGQVHNYQYPQCIFPIGYLSYDDQHNKKHYLSIMPRAPGLQLEKLMESFTHNPHDASLSKTIEHAYFDVGAAMARLHTTQPHITHGDFHHGNVFYDPTTGNVSLIDNTGYNHGGIDGARKDIAFLLMKSLYITHWTNHAAIKNLPLKEWYTLSLKNFVSGYLSGADGQDKQKTYRFLHETLMNYVDPETGIKWYEDKSILGFSHKQYMDVVLKELEANL